jgi:hypothetical protein
VTTRGFGDAPVADADLYTVTGEYVYLVTRPKKPDTDSLPVPVGPYDGRSRRRRGSASPAMRRRKRRTNRVPRLRSRRETQAKRTRSSRTRNVARPSRRPASGLDSLPEQVAQTVLHMQGPEPVQPASR